MEKILALLAFVLFLASCNSDQLPMPAMAECMVVTPTYAVDVRPIIENSCAYSGCHLGAAPGLYDSYEGLLPVLENNTFRQRVISQQANPTVGMPPNYAPTDRPQDLTEEELTIIECWLDAGFPEE